MLQDVCSAGGIFRLFSWQADVDVGWEKGGNNGYLKKSVIAMTSDILCDSPRSESGIMQA